MKTRLITALVIVIAALTLPDSAQAIERGEKSFGISAGYVNRNKSGMYGLYFQWSVAKHVRLAPRASYIFRHEGVDAFDIDVDVHFPFTLDKAERWRIFPLAGVGHYSWGYHNTVTEDDGYNDVSTRTSRLCFNAGAGLEFLATPTLKLGVQGRVSLMKQSTTTVASISIGYVF